MTARVTGVRPCRGLACGVLLPRGRRQHRYCDGCLARRCRECHRHGGRHGRSCGWHEREHRRPPIVFDRVTVDDVETLYRAARPRALRAAAQYVRGDLADDAVQSAAEYLLRRRAIFPSVSPTLFCRLAGWAGLRLAQQRRGWLRLAGGPGELDLLERLDGARVQRFYREATS